MKDEGSESNRTHSSYTWSCNRSSKLSAGLSSALRACSASCIPLLRRNSALGRDLHQAESSSWLMTGSRESEASGVVGAGEGEREQAVVDEDDMSDDVAGREEAQGRGSGGNGEDEGGRRR